MTSILGHTLGALRFRSTPTGFLGRKLGHLLRHLVDLEAACKPSYPSSVYDTRLPGIFCGEGWFVRVDNLEDVIGGHVYVGII